jgi:N-carbamoyl-L-amino-acid hydrolase
MPDSRSRVDGARVLADLNALRGIGAYKTGVHKPTFSEPHMRSLEWLAEQLSEAGLTATIDGIGNVLGTSTKAGSKLLAGSHPRKSEFCGLARWTAWRRLCPRSRPRDQFRSGRERRRRSRSMVR